MLPERMERMSSKTTKNGKKSKAARNVLIFFIVFILLEMALVVSLTLVFRNKDATPRLAGYNFYIMRTDKMGTSVPKGALVVASDGTPSKDSISKALLCILWVKTYEP